MNRSAFLGLIILAAVAVVSVLAPRFFPTQATKNASAAADAELARRQLHNYSPQLPHLAGLVSEEQLKQADLQALVEKYQQTFADAQQAMREAQAAAQARDRKAGVSGNTYDVPNATGSGVKSAVDGFSRLVQLNEALFRDALSLAKNTAQGNREVVGVSHVLGIAEYTRAVNAQLRADALLARLDRQYSDVLSAASDWVVTHALADRYAAESNVSAVVDSLRSDIADVTAQHAEASAKVEELAAVIAEREKQLQEVRSALSASREKLSRIEQQGFTPGDDASFASYRDGYLAEIAVARDLQEREQMLADGARSGAILDKEFLIEGELVGGEEFIGLSEFQRRLEIAAQRVARLAVSKESLVARAAYVEQSGSGAAKLNQEIAAQAAKFRSELDTRLNALNELVTAHAAAGDEAASAADAAARAFRDSQAAVDATIGEARRTQQELDPNRQNERLKRMLDDQFLPQVAASAEAAARLLAARVHLQRFHSAERYAAYVAQLDQVGVKIAIDREKHAETISATRDAAAKALDEAAAGFEKVSRGPAAVAWIPQSSLSIAYYLRAQVDPAQAATHRARALEELSKVLEKREQAAVLSAQVRLRDHITAQTGE